MRQLNTFIWNFITFCLIGCQSQPEVLFENINVGDNIQTCLAKGAIQYQNEYAYRLGNQSIANSYFTYNEVKFDENSVVDEISLFFCQRNAGKTANDVFSFMTQYFCQRYTQMKTRAFDEEKKGEDFDGRYWHKGMINSWETENVHIQLKSYTNTLIDYQFKPHSGDKVVFAWDDDAAKETQGNFVELKISAK